MKETIEVVKCDLCGATIDTKNIPEDEYHYKYHILRPNHDCIDTLEKDICPTCASVINKIYNGKHGEDIDKYIDNYIENVVGELSAHSDFDAKMLINIRALMKRVFLTNKDKE